MPHSADSERTSCRLPDADSASQRAAERAGLVFSSDCFEGISRKPGPDGGFLYLHVDGTPVDESARTRIERLTVPPAWHDVWICADENGHLQATGRDSRGRKQYRYHEAWRSVRDETKYGRLVDFGEVLPLLRARVEKDLARRTLDRRRVQALVVAILDRVLVRVGNAEYARENDSFGLTTLRSEHVDVGASKVRLRFRGKAGKRVNASLDDARIARAIRRVRDLPGQELFQYVDAHDEVHVIGSGDVNEYLRESTGLEITSKDFRTWGGSLAAAVALHSAPGEPSAASVTEAVKRTAELLGNTPAVAKRSYIHPGLIELYLSGRFEQAWSDAERDEPARHHLDDHERIFLGVLRRI